MVYGDIGLCVLEKLWFMDFIYKSELWKCDLWFNIDVIFCFV